MSCSGLYFCPMTETIRIRQNLSGAAHRSWQTISLARRRLWRRRELHRIILNITQHCYIRNAQVCDHSCRKIITAYVWIAHTALTIYTCATMSKTMTYHSFRDPEQMQFHHASAASSHNCAGASISSETILNVMLSSFTLQLALNTTSRSAYSGKLIRFPDGIEGFFSDKESLLVLLEGICGVRCWRVHREQILQQCGIFCADA